jgi:uncharacterized RmlC-like cupin family protein
MTCRALILSSCLVALFGCHSSGKETDDTIRAEVQTKMPAIIAPGEGERIYYPDGRHVNLIVTREDLGASQLILGSEDLPDGTAIPVHSHENYEEIIFIHKGNASLTLGDRVVTADAGTTMYIPPGTWHGVANASGADTTMMFIFPEPGVAEFFREVGHHEGGSPPELTPEDWGRIMEQHGMRARPAEQSQ